MGEFNPKELLLYGLKYFEIQVEREEGQTIFTEQNCVIKIEENQQYRLLRNGKEVRPFRDVAELCNYIKIEHAKSRTEYRGPGQQ